MAKKKTDAEKAIQMVNGDGEKVLIWKATRPLTLHDHENLSQKLRYEQEQSGVKIVLVPYSVEVEVQIEQEPSPQTGQEHVDDMVTDQENSGDDQ